MSLGVICALDQLVSGLERSGSRVEARLGEGWVGPRGVDMYIGLDRRGTSIGRPRQQGIELMLTVYCHAQRDSYA